MVSNYTVTSYQDQLPAIIDREISDPSKDAFGHRHFAQALFELITSEAYRPPFSVGLLGKWGTGKSSIKSLCVHKIQDNHAIRSENKIVSFNAWRFGGDSVKRALLREVFIELGGKEQEIDDALYRSVKRDDQEARPWKDLWRDGWGRVGFPAAFLTVYFGVIFCLLFLVRWLIGLSDTWFLSVVTGSATLAFPLVVRYFFNVEKVVPPRYATVSRTENPRSAAEEFANLLVRQLRRFKTQNGHYKRLIIFIDDLDRLSSEEMIDGLDAVRTFMELDKELLDRNTGEPVIGIVFVISCDEAKIAEALTSKRLVGESVTPTLEARRFLDRVFQYRLEIQPFPKQDMRAYIKTKLKEDLGGVVAQLAERGAKLDNVVDRMIHAGVQSPRNAIQILNAFVQCWWLALKREKEGAGTDLAGGLSEGAVTSHAEALAALCALRVDFPDFYSQLQDEPRLIQAFNEVFHLKIPLDKQPQSAREILIKYVGQDDRLLPMFRPLSQYLSSLQGLRWPAGLQPLLLLSQDPLSRRHGDHAHRIFDALVAGDSDGVLALFGHEYDEQPLSTTDARFLKSLFDDAVQDTESRKHNAAAAVAALAPRLPEAEAPSLLTPLAYQLAANSDLRSRVGLAAISHVLKYAIRSESQEVAERLIADLCRDNEDVVYRLRTGEAPSLDEAVEAVKQGVEIVLNVRKSYELKPSSEVRLLEWLSLRRVSINGSEEHIPFAVLEHWVTEYEDTLLPAFDIPYMHCVLEELGAGHFQEVEIRAILSRCTAILEHRVASGEESRAFIWPVLLSFLDIDEPHGFELAWTFGVKHTQDMDQRSRSKFIETCASRLNDEWPLTEKERLNAISDLVRMAEAHSYSLDETALMELASLATYWSEQGEAESEAVRMVDILFEVQSEHGSDVVDEWLKSLASTLDGKQVEWLVRKFDTALSPAQRTAFFASITQLYNLAGVDEAKASRFNNLTDKISEKIWFGPDGQNFLTSLFAHAANQHGQDAWLRSYFPRIAALVEYHQGAARNSLSTLFANASRPDIFGFLHQQMDGNWPAVDAASPSYNPQTLFDQGYSSLSGNIGQKNAGGIVLSMHSMLEAGLVQETNESKLITNALNLWRSDPRSSSRVLSSVNTRPNLEAIAGLADGYSLEGSGNATNLQRVWTRFVSITGYEDQLRFTSILLQKPPVKAGLNPDAVLGIWLNALTSELRNILTTLLQELSQPDEQRRRLWSHSVQLAAELGNDFFIEMIPKVLTQQQSDATTAAVIEKREAVNNLLVHEDERVALGSKLLGAISTTNSDSRKNEIAHWLSQLGVESRLLRSSSNFNGLKDIDFDVLQRHFSTFKKTFDRYRNGGKG